MKKIFILLFIVFVALQLEAQLVYDKWGNIIPFSSSEKYSVEIEAYNVPSFVIPYMDNDSLSRKYNNGKSVEELGAEYTGGIELRHEPISLKENGICINLEHGKLWRYAIEGVTARGIGVDLGFPKLPKGTYIALIASDTAVNLIQPPMVFHSENLLERHKKRGIRSSVYGEEIIIEYYEPNVLKEKEDIVIKRISYGFVGFGNQRRSSLNDLDLKSGYWGSSEYSGCQNDIVCTDYGNYKNEAKSVVFLDIEFKIDEDGDGYFETKYKNGTGFFLNKAGDYDVNDFPLLVTAGHLYNYKKLGVTPIDIISDITHFYVITKYENKECGTDNTDNKGIQLPGFFNRIALGSSYDEAGLPGYSPNHDYAVLQATSNIDRLADYDLEYGAWYKDHDFYNSSNVGYFCIHHPKGDVKKINKDNHSADLVTFDGFLLKYDLGLTEKGSSGAPVFNS